MTLKQNADKIGICYNYAAVLSRINQLPYRRKKGSSAPHQHTITLPPNLAKYEVDGINRGISVQSFKLQNLSTDQDQWFAGEGAD